MKVSAETDLSLSASETTLRSLSEDEITVSNLECSDESPARGELIQNTQNYQNN